MLGLSSISDTMMIPVVKLIFVGDIYRLFHICDAMVADNPME